MGVGDLIIERPKLPDPCAGNPSEQVTPCSPRTDACAPEITPDVHCEESGAKLLSHSEGRFQSLCCCFPFKNARSVKVYTPKCVWNERVLSRPPKLPVGLQALHTQWLACQYSPEVRGPAGYLGLALHRPRMPYRPGRLRPGSRVRPAVLWLGRQRKG